MCVYSFFWEKIVTKIFQESQFDQSNQFFFHLWSAKMKKFYGLHEDKLEIECYNHLPGILLKTICGFISKSTENNLGLFLI